MENILDVPTLISELKNGNKVRITYNRMIDDCLGGGWSEELWSYDDKNIDKQYICQYPISTYKDDFYTMHTLKEITLNMKDAIRDLDKNYYDGQELVAIKIKIESKDDLDSCDLEEKYLKQMKKLKDEFDHDEADDLLCQLLEELGFTEIVKTYQKLPKWYS